MPDVPDAPDAPDGPDAAEIIADLCSRDRHRIHAASWAVLRSRDDALFAALDLAYQRIDRATDDLDLGGVLHPNVATLDAMLARIRHRRKRECWCLSYPDLLMFDPSREQDSGFVHIDAASEPGWSMTYDVTCAVCGQRYAIEQGEYHYPWWKWVPVGENLADATARR